MEMNEIDKALTIIESPYKVKIDGIASDHEAYVNYAKKCLEHSLSLGEAPFASHLLYTQVLDDNVPEQREQGIDAGLAWLWVADKHVFYIDYGISEGMFKALQFTLARINERTNNDPQAFGGRVPILEFRKIL